MDALSAALARVQARGWRVMELGRYVRGAPSEQPEPWFCTLHPGHFGSYFQGTRGQDGHYRCVMARVRANGRTALLAVERAIALLDASDARETYEELMRAVGEAVAAMEGRHGAEAA